MSDLSAAELTALRSFLAVYRSGGVGKAAEALHLSQPAVSHHLKTLEQTAGRPLFTRVGRGVAPTVAAHRLAAEAGEHVDALQRVLSTLRPSGPLEKGAVFFGGPGDVLAELVLPHAPPLLDAGIELHCQTGLPDELLTGLLSDQLDIAVLTKVEGAPIKQLYLLPWQNEEFVLIGPAGCQPYQPDAEQRFIGYAESMPMARRYFRACWSDSPPSPALTMPDMRGVVRAVQAGAGYAVVPMYLAASGLDGGSLDVAHTADQPVVNPLYLAMRRGREHLPRVRSVFTHLTSTPL